MRFAHKNIESVVENAIIISMTILTIPRNGLIFILSRSETRDVTEPQSDGVRSLVADSALCGHRYGLRNRELSVRHNKHSYDSDRSDYWNSWTILMERFSW